jgi:hypothetical protein
MANTLLTISMITREALRVLENSLTFTKRISRNYDDKYGVAGAKIGTVLNIRKPPRYAGRTGQALSLEDATETSVPLALTTQKGVDIAFTSQDLTLSIDDFSKRFLKPAIASVANAVDYDGTALTQLVWNMVGTPGSFPNTALLYLQAGQRLNEEACPVDDRCIVMGPGFVPPIVDALKGLFQSSERIKEQYEKGVMGTGLGFEWYMDQNMRTQVAGTQSATFAVAGAGQTGSNLAVAALTGTLNKGDVFTIAGVHAVNPQSHQSTGALRQFVVTANCIVGATTVPIAPPIQVYGAVAPFNPFATVDVLPAGGATCTLAFTASQSSGQACAFHPEAFAMACADLLLPGGVDMASRVADDQLGLSIRAIRAYDINLDRFPTRLDILYGFALLYGEMACRIAGA